MNKLNFIVKVSICLKTLNSVLNIWCCYVLIYKLSNLLMLKTVSQRSRINPFHKFLIMTSSIAFLGTSKFLEHSRRSLCGGGCDGGGCVAAGGGGLCVWCACIVFESPFSLPINTNTVFW